MANNAVNALRAAADDGNEHRAITAGCCKCIKGRGIHNILLTVTNLYALRAIIISRSPLLTPILILSMSFSSMYHLCERNYRGHNLSGPRVLLFPSFLRKCLKDKDHPPSISPVNEEKLLLILDRVFSVLAIVAVVATCGFNTVGAVASTRGTAWIAPTAVASLALSELLGNKWVAAYSILHSVSLSTYLVFG
ncbi:hypothetical protein HDU67_005579 [Dinochytrium kinnereticum]|nr:hypothetical protein HDU67_005579 [Dinochytrium kinnereticum]